MPEPLHVLLDQNIPRALVSWIQFRRPTWVVRHSSDVDLSGKSDQDVFAWAQQNRAVVITFDEDFADGRSFSSSGHHGIVRLRIWPTSIQETQHALTRLLAEATDEELRGALVIVGRSRIRIRSPQK